MIRPQREQRTDDNESQRVLTTYEQTVEDQMRGGRSTSIAAQRLGQEERIYSNKLVNGRVTSSERELNTCCRQQTERERGEEMQ